MTYRLGAEEPAALEGFKQLGGTAAAGMPPAMCREFKRGLSIELYCDNSNSTRLPFLDESTTFQEDNPPEGLIKYSAADLQKLALLKTNKCSDGYVLNLFGYIKPTEDGMYRVMLVADAASAIMMIDGKVVARLQKGGVPRIPVCS